MNKKVAKYFWYAFVSLLIALIAGCISQALLVKDQDIKKEEKYMMFYSFITIGLIMSFAGWAYFAYDKNFF